MAGTERAATVPGYVDMNLLIQNSQTPSLALVLQLVWVVLSEVS